MTSRIATHYEVPTEYALAKTSYDWGYYNSISNGGNVTGRWYMLTSLEWKYIFNSRTPTTRGINNNEPTLYTYATIGGTHKGIILFPDDYTHPTDATTTLDDAIFDNYSNFTASVSIADWAKMEAAGAVFLPAAGYRGVTDVSTGCHHIYADAGAYWGGGTPTTTEANRVFFNKDAKPNYSRHQLYFGMSVRVVQDL